MTISITIPVTPEQAAAIIKAGPGSTVHHAHARGRRVEDLKGALRVAGVPHRLVQTLGWSTTGDAPKTSEKPSKARKASKKAQSEAAGVE